MKSSEEYRAQAAESLREAETVPEHMRLNFIIIAQQWLDLADKAARQRSESDDEKPAE